MKQNRRELNKKNLHSEILFMVTCAKYMIKEWNDLNTSKEQVNTLKSKIAELEVQVHDFSHQKAFVEILCTYGGITRGNLTNPTWYDMNPGAAKELYAFITYRELQVTMIMVLTLLQLVNLSSFLCTNNFIELFNLESFV